MAIQADTATADPGSLAHGGDGFTSGDPQASIAPTQLSAAFMNAMCNELNEAISAVGGADVPLNYASQAQLGLAIQRRIQFQNGPDFTTGLTSPAWWRRTFAAVNVERLWRTWFRDSFKYNQTNNTVTTLGHVVVPDNSVFWATFEVKVVQTDSIAVFKTVILRASCRRTGGAVTVDALATVASAGGLGATFDVIDDALSGEPAAAVEVTLPVVIGKSFNIAVSATASNVTTGL